MTNFDLIADVTAIHKNNNDELINNKLSIKINVYDASKSK